MKTALVLTAVVVLAAASKRKVKHVDATTVKRQYEVLELFETINQINENTRYYKIGKDFNIKASIDKYKKPGVVSLFFSLFEKDFLPKNKIFNIFNDKMRQQAKALYDLFYYAEDFEILYKTAAWARVHVNGRLFVYTFYVALIQRVDTKDLVIPPLYELAPLFFINLETINKMFYSRMRGEPFEENPEDGVTKVGKYHVYYQNYSDYNTYGSEYKLAYLTEDIGWNTFFTFYHVMMPFWENGENIMQGTFKERRGEIYYNFYKKLLARFYLERLSNGLGEIPEFSWDTPFKYGFRPFMATRMTPFAQRTDNYVMQNKYNDLNFVRNYEHMFLTFLEQGQFIAFNKQVDFSNSTAINFVGNFWQGNPDLYEKLSERPNYFNSYERAAYRILGGASTNFKNKNYDYIPSVMDFTHTALRDPAFYQIHNKIWRFMAQYKQYLPPYSQESLHYIGVKITKLEVSNLETFFDFYQFNASNAIFYTNQELTSGAAEQNVIIQPRMLVAPFTVKISVKSDFEDKAAFKIFIGPESNSNGVEIQFEDNWMNFLEMDTFLKKNLPRVIM